jgi:hypothetical protein
MSPDLFFSSILLPSANIFSATVPKPAPSLAPEALVLLMAIAGQESNWSSRLQQNGPARGFWQFEKNEATLGLLTLSATRNSAMAFCAALDIPSDLATVDTAMAWNDPLAFAMARLLLWSDPAPLPAVGDQDTAINYYQRLWRPGAFAPSRRPTNYAAAVRLVAPTNAKGVIA